MVLIAHPDKDTDITDLEFSYSLTSGEFQLPSWANRKEKVEDKTNKTEIKQPIQENNDTIVDDTIFLIIIITSSIIVFCIILLIIYVIYKNRKDQNQIKVF